MIILIDLIYENLLELSKNQRLIDGTYSTDFIPSILIKRLSQNKTLINHLVFDLESLKTFTYEGKRIKNANWAKT
jgi:hypothetical protein